jgi:PAS domain S-box-containing protein
MAAGDSKIPAIAEPDFRSMLEALPIAVYATDADGRVTFYNEAAVELAGRRPVLGDDQWCVSWRLWKADGTPLAHEDCPMAVALRENRPVRGIDAVAERPDGSRVPFLPFPTPLRDASGNLVGAVNLLVDLTKLSETETHQAWLAAIVESSDDAIVSKTLGGRITSWNAGAQRIFGYTPDEIVGQSILKLIPPELHGEEEHIVSQLRRGQRVEHFETIRVTKDGRRIDISLTVSPVRDRSGRIIGASKVARDVTERKRTERTQQLLLNELNHRVKNTLANVQAIVQHTLRSTRDPAEFAAGFSGRIQSLARVHSMLTESSWEGADLGSLIRDQLLMGPVDESRLIARGPSVRLDSQMTMHIALMLHELGTNSTKHGALSVAEGRVAIEWSVKDDLLHLRWVERGGPVVSAPSKRGFGMALIEQGAMSGGGSAEMVCEADGISWDIRLVLPAADSSAALPHPRIPAAVAQHSPAAAGAQLVLSGRRLLVVEDEPLVALDIINGLRETGAVVIGPAGTEQSALELIERGSLDAALLDANLHGRPVDRIAAALTRRQIPFVFVSGHSRDGLPVPFADAPLLKKPFSPSQLVEAVRQITKRDAGLLLLRLRS